MGTVNGVGVAAALLVALGLAWWRFSANRQPARLAAVAGLLAISAGMIGHMFARVGTATLAAKPWLYFMMSGGLALAFIAPALAIAGLDAGRRLRALLADAAFWIGTYLAMGLAFLLTA